MYRKSLGMAVAISFWFVQNIFAHTLFISPPATGEEINKIVADAEEGDTVLFRSGHYFVNNIIIQKSIYLKGENSPVLDGHGKYQIISIESNDVIVDGFKLINTGLSDMFEFSAIRIVNSRRVSIKNNILENVFFGVYCLNVSQSSISNNRIKSNSIHELQSGNGIHCWKSDSLHIFNNYISGQRDGIYFEFVTNSFIERNISEKNLRYGLHFMFSQYNNYSHNIFSNNGAGVAVMFSHHVTMYKNIFAENRGESSYGILMKEIRDSKVEKNYFTKNSIGILMEGTSRINVENNTFESNGWAFKIQASCEDIMISANRFFGNTFDVATNGTLVLNKFSGNYWDKYEGYDLNKDGIGDVPYRPVSMYSMITEKIPYSIMLFRSFMVMLLEKTEKIIPSLTPIDLKDDHPLMKPPEL